MREIRRFVTVVGLVLGLCVPNIRAALAAPPSNDGLRGAVEVSSIPFIYKQDTSEATANGPTDCGNSSSVFFSFTPTRDASVQVDTFGSNYDTVLTVFTRRGGISEIIACNDDAAGLQSAVRVDASAGTTYYLQVAACCLSGVDNTGGHLVLAVTNVPTESLQATAVVDAQIRMPYRGGVVRITGTLSCNQRSVVEVFGVLRQLRPNDFVAKGFFGVRQPVACSPGRVVNWGAWADTQTGTVFAEGRASVRPNVFATNGFEGFIMEADQTHVQIVQG